jgi:hypothetical protein
MLVLQLKNLTLFFIKEKVKKKKKKKKKMVFVKV